MAAAIGVPLYACGGGTIPLLQQWLFEGMSVGSAVSFMLTGPAPKITNLGALKIVLGAKHFFVAALVQNGGQHLGHRPAFIPVGKAVDEGEEGGGLLAGVVVGKDLIRPEER